MWYEARVQGTAAADTGQAYSGDNTEAMDVKGTDVKGTDTAAAASEAEGLSDTAAVGSSGNAGGMEMCIRDRRSTLQSAAHRKNWNKTGWSASTDCTS